MGVTKLVQSSIKAAIGVHVTLSVISITYGAVGYKTNDNNNNNNNGDHHDDMTKNSTRSKQQQQQEAFDARHYDMVTLLIRDMYGGKGIHLSNTTNNDEDDDDDDQNQAQQQQQRNENNNDNNNNNSHVHVHEHVKFDSDITFEDPAAICYGPNEVKEAFRALQVVQPKSLSEPICINVSPKGHSIDLTYSLNQQYGISGKKNDDGGTITTRSIGASINGMLKLHVRSLLIVTVHLVPIKDVPESEFMITKIEERWNGVSPLGTYLFWFARRCNGILSYNLTSRFI